MIELLMDYGLFLAKTVTVVLGIGALILVAAMAARKEHEEPRLQVKKLNDHYDELARGLRAKALPRKRYKASLKAEKKAHKALDKSLAAAPRPRVYVLDFKGDIRASGVSALREEVSAIVAMAQQDDEVLLRLENAGGLVHDHGLAASQVARIKAHGIPLTVAVDKIAASGGYMMASVADRVVAAPFAVLGSIGVLAQLPNLHRLLEGKGIDFEQFKGGRFKRTVTVFGQNTDADREKFQQEIDETHTLFKRYVQEQRPGLDMDQVATGEHWFGRRAIELGLCDEIGTSDDWLMQRRDEKDLLRVRYRERRTLPQRIARSVEAAPGRALDRVLERLWAGRLEL